MSGTITKKVGIMINLIIVITTTIEPIKEDKGTIKTEGTTEGITIEERIIITESQSTKIKKGKQIKRHKTGFMIINLNREETVPGNTITSGKEITPRESITGTETITKKEIMRELMKIRSAVNLIKDTNTTKTGNTKIGNIIIGAGPSIKGRLVITITT